MWLPGHFAVALIMSLPLLLVVKEKRVLAIAFVAFFAAFPDFLHLGNLRMVSHSLIGLTILLALALGALWLFFRPKPIFLGIGALSAASHLGVDYLVGNLTPFYPISTMSSGPILGIGFDLPMEVGLMVEALAILALYVLPSGGIGLVRSYTRAEKLNLQVLLVPLILMAALEGGYYLLFNFRAALGLLTGGLVIDFLLLFVAPTLIVLYSLDARAKLYEENGGETMLQRWLS